MLAVLALALGALLARSAVVCLALKKCCPEWELLSGDGAECVAAPWPRDASSFRWATHDEHSVVLPPLDATWARRWLPPGLPLHRVDYVCLDHRFDSRYRDCSSYDPMLKYGYEPTVTRAVNESAAWDPKRGANENENRRKARVVFEDKFIVRPRRRGGYRRFSGYCVDAALPPLGPFAVRFVPSCNRRQRPDDCVSRCCTPEEALVEEDGMWRCRRDRGSYWSPLRSRFLDPESPTGRSSLTFVLSSASKGSGASRRVVGGESTQLHFAQDSVHEFLFATWTTCVDFRRQNGSLREVVLYREYPRVERGIYWLLRPLCCVSVLLLAVALASVACDRGLRRKVHGWCLASHAVCLLGFNLGHVAYFLGISDEVDASDELPPHLVVGCENLASSLYFFLMAANSWLTAICVNTALGFRKMQVVRPNSRRNRRQFLVLAGLAWGLPVLMATLCICAKPDPADILSDPKWYTPMLIETRVCFREEVLIGRKHVITQKSGTILFYYGPVCGLVLANVMCLAYVLRQVRFLRRGNSVLARDEDGRGGAAAQGGSPGAALKGGKDGKDEGKLRATARRDGAKEVDAKTIKLYIKMLLMTGVIEMAVEVIVWATSNTTGVKIYEDHMYSYRASGYATDCFRAACVAWLAAPEGGYLGALRRRRKDLERTNMTKVT